jgi:hypothetical protein
MECTSLFRYVIQFMAKAVSNSKLHPHFSRRIVLLRYTAAVIGLGVFKAA